MNWKTIPGYEGYYECSDTGLVRSVDRVVQRRNNSPMKLRGRIMKMTPQVVNGRVACLIVTLAVEGINRVVKVHRIVLLTWCGPCPDGLESCHDDGDATNNSVSNLRWDSHSSNVCDAIKHGTHRMRRVRRSDGVEFGTIKAGAESVGCYPSNIHNVLSGRRKSAGGYTWEYCDGICIN